MNYTKLLLLMLMAIFSGCEVISKIKIQYPFLNKNSNPSSNTSLKAGMFYKASIIKGEFENDNQNTIINYLDSTNTLKSIDLGFYGNGFEKVAFVDNYLFFKTESNPDTYDDLLYFINFNLPQPLVVDASSLDCNFRNFSSIAIREESAYCVTSADRLKRFELEDWTNSYTYTTSLPDTSWGFIIRLTDYSGGLLVELNDMEGSEYMHVVGDTVQDYWPRVGNYKTNHGTEGKVLKQITNGFVTLEADYSLTVRRTGQAASMLEMPGINRTNAGIYFSESFLTHGDSAYYIICNKPGNTFYYGTSSYGIRNFSGDSGLYIANIANIASITTERIDLGDVDCTLGSRLYELNGDIYLKSSYKNREGAYLFKYDSSDTLEPFKEIAKISDYFRGKNDLVEMETLLSSDIIQDTVLNIGSKLCFTAKNNDLYYPSCINESGNLIIVSNVGNAVSDDSLSDAGEFDGELYYLSKMGDDVKLYHSNLTNHSAIIDSAVGSNLNLKDYWSYIKMGGILKKVIYGKNSNLLFIQQVIKEQEVRYEDATGETKSFYYRTMIEEQVEYTFLYTYKDQKYYLHLEGNAMSLFHHSGNQKVKVIDEEILYSVIDWREQVFVYSPRYYFYINTNYQLMRFDFETNTKLLIDTNVNSLKKRDDLIVYNKGFSDDINIYDVKTFELTRVENPINLYFDQDSRPEAFKLAPGKYLIAFVVEINPLNQYYIYENGSLRNVTNADTSNFRIFYRNGVEFSNDKYFVLNDDDFSYSNTSYLIDYQSGAVVKEIVHNQEDIRILGLMTDAITGKSYYNTSLSIDSSGAGPIKEINIIDLQISPATEITYSLPSEMNDHDEFFDASSFLFFNGKLYVSFTKDGKLRVYELRPNSQTPILKFEDDIDYLFVNELADTLLNNNLRMFNDDGILTLTMTIQDNDNLLFKKARLVDDEFVFVNDDIYNNQIPADMHLMHYYIGSKYEYPYYDYNDLLGYLKWGEYSDDRVEVYYLNPDFKLSTSVYYNFENSEYRVKFHEQDNFSKTFFNLDFIYDDLFSSM